ncbi:hypothetical protein ATER59S_00402 [Aquamicrobium terrae]
MNWHWLENPRRRLDIAAGVVDGILNALTLAAGTLLKSGHPATIQLAFRIGVASALTTLFVFFVAHYAELRAELDRAERQLNLLSHGPLVSSRLGRKAMAEALGGACVAAVCGFAGSLIPLVFCVFLPGPPWVGIAFTIAILGAMGAALAKSFHGSPLSWTLVIMAGGIVLTMIGFQLNLVD